jgi:hypothetical protein
LGAGEREREREGEGRGEERRKRRKMVIPRLLFRCPFVVSLDVSGFVLFCVSFASSSVLLNLCLCLCLSVYIRLKIVHAFIYSMVFEISRVGWKLDLEGKGG